jgi:hypothetical protein
MGATRIANYNSAGPGTSSQTCAYTSGNTSGNSLICVVYSHHTSGTVTGFAVSDNAGGGGGNTWNLQGSFYSASDPDEGWTDSLGVYLVSSCLAGANTVTATRQGSSANCSIQMCVIEYADASGLLFDTSNNGHDYSGSGSNAINSGDITTSVQSDVIIGFATTGNYPYTFPSSPWTQLALVTGSSNCWLAVADNLNVASGTTGFNGTSSGNPNWLAAIFAFKAGGGPPPPPSSAAPNVPTFWM